MRTSSLILRWSGFATAAILLSAVAWWTSPQWLPAAQEWIATAATAPKKTASHDDDGHAGHDHGHGHEHNDATSLELSRQARLNIGLTTDMIRPIELQSFTRKMTVPAMVTGLPGKTWIKVVAPMSGVVTDVYPIEGENVEPGQRLFKIRLIHEDLVQAQTSYLKSLGALDVEKKEIARLQKLAKEGALAERVLLERQYEKHKLEAVLRAQHEALLLHGLTEGQVQQIVNSRKLLGEFIVHAPVLPVDSGEMQLIHKPMKRLPSKTKSPSYGVPREFVVKKVSVSKGDFVQAGGTLCVMADYSRLYIQGRAFAEDTDELARAVQNGWKVTAVLEDNRKRSQTIDGLNILYLDHEVEPTSRAFHFYISLPNEILGKKEGTAGHQFVTWRFKPGQRMQVLVPVEKWKKRIVVPIAAVAKEGAEYFVFQQNGSHFDRRPVHVEYRDQFWAVIANDGSLFPGDYIAFTGAHQMEIALKNKAGGGVDPHAGHHH